MERNPRSAAFVVWRLDNIADSETIEEIAGLSDRSGAIVATTLLENYVFKALRRVMCDDEKFVKKLFDRQGLLTNFGARIRLLRALGLVTNEGYCDLDLICKIRNAFAHKTEVRTFDHQEIAKHCRELKLTDTVDFQDL
jgi:DNA-binding MltR family transcriptional regulator